MQSDLFVKMNKNNQYNSINQHKKIIVCSHSEVRPALQDVRIQCKLENSDKLNSHQIKDINLPKYQSAYGIIQMFNPDNPVSWKRPNFYAGIKGKLWDRQLEWYRHVIAYLDNITGKVEITEMTLCPICRELLGYQGATIDHITNWREYAQKIWHVRTEEGLNEAYNDTENLILVHASCNSSKGDSEISQFGVLGHIPGRRATWGTAPELEEMGKRLEKTISKISSYYDDDGESRRNIQELKQMYSIYRITGNATNLDSKLNFWERFFEIA